MVTLTNLYDDGSHLYKACENYYHEKQKKDLERLKKKYRSISDRYIPPTKRPRDNEDYDLVGDARIMNINKYLNSLYRSPQQKEFHRTFISSCLRIVYGDEFENNKHGIMKKYNFHSRKQQVILTAPRRFGKTFSVAFFCVAFAISIPGVEISIFSPAKRQSVALMGVIVDFLKKLDESNRVVIRNEEKLKLQSLNGEISRINAYPSAVRTLKGVSGSVIILEEMAQIPPEVLYEVVVPLHQLDATSIIGISTITTENNFMTKYIKQKDAHGEPVFGIERIYLACAECRANDMAHSCNHVSNLLPRWSSQRKKKKIDDIMKNQEEMLAREIGGVASVLHQKAFPMKFIRKLSEEPPISLSYEVSYDHVFHAIDPNGAGKSSDYAILSMVKHNGLFIIVGMESYPTTTALENDDLLIKHLTNIRRDSRFTNAMSVFIIESNLGLESERIANMLKDNYTNYVVMTERDDGRHLGFRTTASVKTLSVDTVREQILSHVLKVADENTMVSFRKDIVPFFIEQLEEFAIILKESSTDKPSKKYSGKEGGGKDDLVMALLIMMHWHRVWYTSVKYSHYHK